MSMSANLHCTGEFGVLLDASVLNRRFLEISDRPALSLAADSVGIFANSEQLAEIATVLLEDPGVIAALAPRYSQRILNAAVEMSRADKGFRDDLWHELRNIEDDERPEPDEVAAARIAERRFPGQCVERVNRISNDWLAVDMSGGQVIVSQADVDNERTTVGVL